MSRRKTLAQEIGECIAEGHTNPDVIATLLGVDVEKVQAALAESKSENSRNHKRDILMEIASMSELLDIAKEQYRDKPISMHAQALSTLVTTRANLLKQLSLFADPKADIRLLDTQVLAPLVRGLIVALSRMMQGLIRSLSSLMPDERKPAMREIVDRLFLHLSSEVQAQYTSAVASVGVHFQVELDGEEVKELESNTELGKLTKAVETSEEDDWESPPPPLQRTSPTPEKKPLRAVSEETDPPKAKKPARKAPKTPRKKDRAEKAPASDSPKAQLRKKLQAAILAGRIKRSEK